MAASGTFNLTSNHSQLSAYITWVITNQNISNNTSTVYAQLWIKKNQSIATSGYWSGYLNVGGNSENYSVYYALTDSAQCAWEQTITVYHNSDGTGTCYLGASVKGPSGTSMSSASASGSTTVTLNSIARTSSVTATTAKIGAASTITISRQSSSFTHTLTYSFAGETTATGTIATKTSSTSVSWTVPKSLYNNIPNKTSGKITITCQTYSGSTLVGSSTCSFTASANSADCKPLFSPTIQDTNSTTTALTGDASKLVRYYSTAKVTSNAAGQYNATISSQKISAGSRSSTSSPATFTNIETNTFTFTATDSRGYSNTVSKSATMVDYVKLTCYIDNTSPSTDGTFNFRVKGNYFNGSFGSASNSLTVYYRWKTGSGSYTSWRSIAPSFSGNSYSATAQLTGLDYQTTYYFQAYAVDKLASVYTDEKAIKSLPIFDWSDQDFAFHVPITINGLPVYTHEVLYSGSSAGTITLAESASNFDYLEIYFTDNNNRGYAFTKVYEPNGKEIELSVTECSANGVFYLRQTRYTVDGTTLTPSASTAGYVCFYSETTMKQVVGSNYIKIYRVVGYRSQEV